MITLSQVVVVEGKYDKIRLESLIDALIITTDGFGIFKNKEKMSMLRTLAQKHGLIIMTDSDSAGFLIRNHFSGSIPTEYITHVYIPDILGKEKRKDEWSKEGKLGVEGMPTQVLLDALERAGVTASSQTAACGTITRDDLYDDGYIGAPSSSSRRKALLAVLSLPEHMSTSSLLKVINSLVSKEEYDAMTEDILSRESKGEN